MKILCSLSSIEFEVTHFPGTFYSKETHHPVFNLPQKRLLSYIGKWAGNELTPTDSYLLFLAILKSSDLVEFRVPAYRTPQTDSIIANNMEFLVRTVVKLNTVSNPAVVFPHYVISPDTKFLTNVHYWIENWHQSYIQFQEGYRREIDDRKLLKRESALERMIKNPHKPISSYASEIASWAALAGSFPTFLTTNPFSQLAVPISDYWREIIRRCASNDTIFSVPKKDIEELLEHCEDHIPIGSIYAHALFKVLRTAIEKQRNFLGIGEIDVRATYAILDNNSTAEQANMHALMSAAPDEKPQEKNYPTKFKYLQAKLRWEMSQKYGDSK
jgi:hypothetical protein